MSASSSPHAASYDGGLSTTSLSLLSSSSPFSSSPSSSSSSHGIVKCDSIELYSQQLNNAAALCIESGQYDRAIVSLQRALRLLKVGVATNTSPRPAHTTAVASTRDGTYIQRVAAMGTPSSPVLVPPEDDEETATKGTNTNGGGLSKVHTSCTCYGCTLDGCIAYSESHLPPTIECIQIIKSSTKMRDASRTNSNSSNKKRKNAIEDEDDDVEEDVSSSRRNTPSKKQKIEDISTNADVNDDIDDSSSEDGYIYRRPIRISNVGHAMGYTLLEIISFNLALSHQLKVIGMGTYKAANSGDNDANAKQQKKLLRKAFLLYKSTLELEAKRLLRNARSNRDDDDGSTTTTNCLGMIIYNNLSQLYRFVHNMNHSKQCLKKLLSMVMVKVEYRTRHEDVAITNGNRNNNSRVGEGSRYYNSQQDFQQDQSSSSSFYHTINIDGFMKNLCSAGCSLIFPQVNPSANAA